MTSTRYDERPFIAIWETTQACDLVCKHCRACAQPERSRDELSTQEAFRLLDRFAEVRVPLVVLTGGDPAKRPDLLELVHYGTRRGLAMGLTPSTTPLVTPELVERLAQAGLKRLAVSIDGPEPMVHDGFRGVSGSFEHSLRILAAARAAGIPTQVNTSVHAGSIDRLSEMAAVVRRAGSVLWSVFFLVPTGRAEAHMLPSADAVEAALSELADIAQREPFAVKTTAAQHYRRVLLQRKKATGSQAQHGVYGQQAVRINDGRGFLFVSHRGEIFPSGFLPIPCGNVRGDDVIAVYREHPVFRALRDPGELGGKCGACEYKSVCGGSRARAFGLTGDYLASDPLCAYQPPGWVDDQEGAPRRLRHLAMAPA
ncbi:MAG: TIGR04053 family radical SAM/SPASM domain-containing protein [Myxococcales bacterium]|nr:TIGR04053 family radical SAM/SPASM domain-containing protein [Myxococcales bacterium]